MPRKLEVGLLKIQVSCFFFGKNRSERDFVFCTVSLRVWTAAVKGGLYALPERFTDAISRN